MLFISSNEIIVVGYVQSIFVESRFKGLDMKHFIRVLGLW
jgi:hypothetical protein